MEELGTKESEVQMTDKKLDECEFKCQTVDTQLKALEKAVKEYIQSRKFVSKTFNLLNTLSEMSVILHEESKSCQTSFV